MGSALARAEAPDGAVTPGVNAQEYSDVPVGTFRAKITVEVVGNIGEAPNVLDTVSAEFIKALSDAQGNKTIEQ